MYMGSICFLSRIISLDSRPASSSEGWQWCSFWARLLIAVLAIDFVVDLFLNPLFEQRHLKIANKES